MEETYKLHQGQVYYFDDTSIEKNDNPDDEYNEVLIFGHSRKYRIIYIGKDGRCIMKSAEELMSPEECKQLSLDVPKDLGYEIDGSKRMNYQEAEAMFPGESVKLPSDGIYIVKKPSGNYYLGRENKELIVQKELGDQVWIETCGDDCVIGTVCYVDPDDLFYIVAIDSYSDFYVQTDIQGVRDFVKDFNDPEWAEDKYYIITDLFDNPNADSDTLRSIMMEPETYL